MSEPVKIVVNEQPVRICKVSPSYLDGAFPFALANAYVDQDTGHLMFAVYGFNAPDNLSIDSDGHLIITEVE